MRISKLLTRLFPLALCLCITVTAVAPAALAADTPQDQRKQTRLGKYVTAVEAFAMWRESKGAVAIVDVRTPEEYDLLGHPDMAANAPFLLWTGNFDAAKKASPLAANPKFVDEIKKRFKATDTLVLMCRSGQRSAVAANKLAEAGFSNVYSMVDGFEGEKVADKASPDFGHRVKDGWRNSRNPWTQDLDEKLVYLPGN